MKNATKKPKKVISDKILNLYHPKIAKDIEFAFEAGGVKYYCFKTDSEVRYGRYIVLQAFLQEYHLRVDLDTLQANIKKLKGWLNPPVNREGQGTLQLGKALELLEIMEQRANIAFEPDTVYRLASVLYFDDSEILSGYDKKYNEEKIARWKESETVDFFFHKLFRESTRLMVSSREDLLNYLRLVPALTKGWNTMEGILSQ